MELIETPLIKISPSVGSYNLSNNFKIVDFPDPGPPINATLAPAGIWKERLSKTFLSVLG
ncbi:hypothetical protein ES708_26305 [subsurface metagenome]